MNSILFETGNLSASAHWDILFCGAFVILITAMLLYTRAIPQGGKNWWVLATLSGVMVIVGMLVGDGWGRILLFDGAAFLAAGMILLQDEPQARAAGRAYLIFLSVAVVFLAAGIYLADNESIQPAFLTHKLAAGFLITGFCLKLALFPVYFWLPEVAKHAKPMTTALIVSVVDIAAFSELVHLRETTPWLFEGYATLWLVIALLCMFGGALLALAQRNIKSMLAFSTIDDMGYLIFGVLAGAPYGVNGAILAGLSHAFFKMLLFAAVGLVEYRIGHDLTLDDRGMASQNPVSAAVFICSAIGMIGVPPFFGFAGRWRLYLSAIEYGGVILVIAFILATALALLYYVRVIHRVWLGKPGELTISVPGKEPSLATVIMLVLLVFMLVSGLYSHWLTRFLV